MALYKSFEDATRAARERLPVSRLLVEHGVAVPTRKEKFVCPICTHKTAEVHTHAGIEMFKCWHPTCASAGDSIVEAKLLGFLLNQSPKDAYWMWLKEAGIDKEDVELPPRSESPKPKAQSPKPTANRPSQSQEVTRNPDVSEVDRMAEAPDDIDLGPLAVEPVISEAVVSETEGTADGELPLLPPSETAKETPAGDLGAGESGAQTADDEVQSSKGKIQNLEAGPGDDPEAGPAASDEDPATLIKREFWESLLPEDDDILARKRGFTVDTIKRFGLRANTRDNEDRLRALEKKHGVKLMVRSGLYHYPKDRVKVGGKLKAVDLERNLEEAKPNPQFYGYGLVNLKTEEWDWTHPTIIPYTNLAGQVVDLRPHKGGIRVDWSSYNAVQRFYVARPVGMADEPGVKCALITEGEFKAMAFWQVFNWSPAKIEYAAAAMPGIQAIHNHYVADGCLRWLERVQPEQVVIVFDNEEKGNPRLPGYKPLALDRHDTAAWAMRTAKLLKREGYNVGVASLPDAWRNEKGKADWDGDLAAQLIP